MTYPSIRIEGQIFSGELLQRLDQTDLPGQRPADFGLPPDTKVKDEIARAWAAAQSYYRAFKVKVSADPASSIQHPGSATSETRNLWLVPLLSLLGYQPEFARRGEEVNGKNYPISHRDEARGGLALHLLGWNDSLDKRRDDGSGPRMSAHALVQEYLNVTEHLYGLVSNGRTLRLLRDSTRLVRQSFIEFDLERMFDEDLFADFAILFRLVHATRLPVAQSAAATSLVEQYHQDALDQGARIRDGLSTAVERAILGFANGFLAHRDNDRLREAIAAGHLTPDAYYNQLLRLIYRFLFLMVTEERQLIFPASVPARKRLIYYRHYSLQRIRRLADRPHLADRRHHDLWDAIRANFRVFEEGGPGHKLDIAPLAGDLFSPDAIGLLAVSRLDNGTVLDALRALSLYENPDTRQLVRVNYAALNVEEFGSVYEGLLEYAPTFVPGPPPAFAFQQGDDRAATGSHYTPDELVQPLIRHSLDYLIADKLKEKDPGKALLSLRVADISCGSGHILLAAARRIATELAIVRTGEEQPSPVAFRAAVRDVIRECIYGVDLNPLAVELCKVALWLEAHNPGEPLNFLDHHIKCGNAIVGYARREDVDRGVPDEAFKALPGDDKDIAAALRKRNKAERKDRAERQGLLSYEPVADQKLAAVLRHWRAIAGLSEKTPAEIAAKKTRYEAFIAGPDASLLKQVLAVPIAQFYLPKTDAKKLSTDAEFRQYWAGERIPQGESAAAAWATAHRKRFFHWFLEFPEVFQGLSPTRTADTPVRETPELLAPARAGVPAIQSEGPSFQSLESGAGQSSNGWKPGFDCILGNPPYIGRGGLRSAQGDAFCAFAEWYYAPSGLSDLVAFFVRRIHALLRTGGFTAFITTNSIKDGEVRKDGLEQVISEGGAINMAVRGIKWPGHAKLVVSLLAIHKGDWKRPCSLDGSSVPHISAFLEPESFNADPEPITTNADQMSVGNFFMGDGFLLENGRAHQIIASEPASSEVVRPVINGSELNSDPMQEPGRHIVNFYDWSLEKAQDYKLAFAHILPTVKPYRESKPDPGKWWQHWRPRLELYRRIKILPRCFACARTTKHLSFSACRTDVVFTDATYVFTTDRWDLYAVVQSTIHEVWARKYSGALKQDLRYSPSKCFETYPFPAGQWQTPNPALAAIGERYHEHRRALMRGLWLGLTDLYNLFHDPALEASLETLYAKRATKPTWRESIPTDAGHLDQQSALAGIRDLRRLHVELDQTVLAAYTWPDLALGHDFVEVETLPENDRTRFTITPAARKELLKRLLAENHRRAAPEGRNGKGAARTTDANAIADPTGTSRLEPAP